MKSSAAVVLALLLFTPACSAADRAPATERDVSALEARARQGDRESIRQLFELFPRSDGAVTEAIDIALGQVIASHPRTFLEELKQSGISPTSNFLGGLLGNLGEEFVDRFEDQAAQLKKRRAALLTVREKGLMPLRDKCVAELDRDIQMRVTAAQEEKGQAK